MGAAYISSLRRKISELEGEFSDALGREDDLSLTIEALEAEISALQERLAELEGGADE